MIIPSLILHINARVGLLIANLDYFSGCLLVTLSLFIFSFFLASTSCTTSNEIYFTFRFLLPWYLGFKLYKDRVYSFENQSVPFLFYFLNRKRIILVSGFIKVVFIIFNLDSLENLST